MRSRIASWMSGLFRRGRVEREMSAEIEFHLAARREDLMRSGLSEEEAPRQARLEFGAVDKYREECRQSRGLRWMDELRCDLRYAWRQMGKSPAFSLLAAAVLAIGIGATTAVFSAVDAVLLRMLPVREPGALRRLEWTARRAGFMHSYDGSARPNSAGERVYWSISYPVYSHLRDHASSFADLFAFGDLQRLNLSLRGHAELANGQIVSGSFFSALGTSAVLGRTLTPEDDLPGSLSSVAVVSHGYWQRVFGGDPQLPGQTLAVNGTPVVIVGVLPKGWCGVSPNWCPDLFLPMAMQPVVYTGPSILGRPDYWYFEVMGRLRPDVAEEQARVEIETLMRQAILAYKPKDEYDPPRVTLAPGGQGQDSLRYQLSRPLAVLAQAVSAVLLIACANLAGLLLARAAARRREIGTRLALGAGRGRLIRQLLTESLLLSVLGGIAGVALAHLAGDAIARMFILRDEPLGVAATMSFRVLAFSAGLCLITGVAFGLAPALRATRLDLVPALRASGATAARARLPLGKALIAVQVGLSLTLTAGAALFVRTLINLKSESLGFRPENLLVSQLSPMLNGYRDQRLLDFVEEITKRVGQLPGVRSASVSRHGLLAGGRTSDTVVLPGQRHINVDIHYIAPRFFETMGFPLLLGRDFGWSDREGRARVAILNETLAKQLFSGQNPVGRNVEMNGALCEVVGVAGDTKYSDLRNAVRPTTYLPFRQHPQHSMTFVARSEVAPKALIASVRGAIESVDPNVPIYAVRTQEEQISKAMRRERLFASLLSGFGGLALVLACLGIYGTLAYLVRGRTPEIGIRMALGATRSDVFSLILRESLVPVLVGILGGLGGALAGGRLVESLLFGVKARDSAALVTAAAVLVACALVAGLLPARGASRIAPMEALRHD